MKNYSSDTKGITKENAKGFEELMIARHGKPQAPEVVKYMYAPILPPEKETYYGHNKCNIAQAIMLMEEKLLSREDAAGICKVCLKIDELGPDGFPFDPKLGMAFFNYESYMTDILGHDVAGRLHIGRSRIDYNTASARISVRENLRKLLFKLLDFRKTLIEIADANKDTLMPGYTHMQSAQPTTYAEYLLSLSSALKRSYDRLLFAYNQHNISPLGSAATAGTAWPLNRERLADLLGFKGVMENDHDAGQQYDNLLAITGATNTLMSTMNRFCTDLYIWCSNEFNLVELDGAFAGTSSIMPQKKNPYPIEVAIGRAGEVSGFYIAMLNTLVGGTSGFPIMRYAGEPYCNKSMQYAWDVLDMMEPVMKTLILKKDRMEELAGDYFAQSVELADVITRKTGMAFRYSHLILGNIVKYCYANGLKPKDVDLAMVKMIADAEGRDITGLTEEDVKQAMDCRHFIESRDKIGGPAPSRTAKQVAHQNADLQKDSAELKAEQMRIDECNNELYGIAKELAAECDIPM